MKKKYKLVLKVPKTPKSAYNHGRFISSLIEHQIKHFHDVEKALLKAGQKLTDISKIKTELHASKYLKRMTALLHPQGADKHLEASWLLPVADIRKEEQRKEILVACRAIGHQDRLQPATFCGIAEAEGAEICVEVSCQRRQGKRLDARCFGASGQCRERHVTRRIGVACDIEPTQR